MLQLNDDVLLAIITIVSRNLHDFFYFRGVCRRFRALSEDLALWLEIYNFVGLSRAFGPPSWHSTNALQDHVKRYHRISRNLESGAPLFTHHFQYSEIENSSDILMHGRFLFFVTRHRTLVCLDMEKALRLIWEHRDLGPSPWSTVLVRSCDIWHTDEPGLSEMTVVVFIGLRSVKTITLDLIHEPSGFVQLVEIESKMVNLPFDSPFHSQQAWFTHGTPPDTTLFNAHTSRVYHLNTLAPEDFSLFSVSFVGTDHLVTLHSHKDETQPAILSIYLLPSRDTAPSCSGGLDRVFRVDTPYVLSFVKELHPPWYQDPRSNPTSRMFFLTGLQWDDEGSFDVQLCITINHMDYQATITPVELPNANYMEYMSQQHSWVVSHAPHTSQIIFLTRIKYSAEA